jgi:hypothetical protein
LFGKENNCYTGLIIMQEKLKLFTHNENSKLLSEAADKVVQSETNNSGDIVI